MKECTRCKTIKKVEDFPTFYKDGILRRRGVCRVCLNKSASIAAVNTKNKYRKIVFEYYGSKCACCGEDEPMFLMIDHINGGGTRHTNSLPGRSIYAWLVKNNFPEGFQLLCANCNWGKERNGGTCPHQAILRLVGD
jgi:hypothetical protein